MATPSRTDRLRALPTALRRQQSLGPLAIPPAAGLTAGFLASFAVDAVLFEIVDIPMRQLIDGLVFALVAASVWIAVQRADVRAAIDTLTWLNGWETERWQREVGRRLPAVPRATPAMVDALPDTIGLRPLRVELLGASGELDEAWRRLEQLPADTPWQRFERAWLTEWLLWLGGGPPALAPMEAAAAEVPDEERALVARAMVAAARARRAAVDGGDVVGPLAAIRPALGTRPARYAFGSRTGIVVAVTMVSFIAVAAVTLTAALIR